MGMFAKTANVDYRLLFADQEKQTFVFCLKKTNGNLLFLFSVCSKQTEVVVFRQFHFLYIYIFKQQHLYGYKICICIYVLIC
jgi:hypothetical protein